MGRVSSGEVSFAELWVQEYSSALTMRVLFNYFRRDLQNRLQEMHDVVTGDEEALVQKKFQKEVTSLPIAGFQSREAGFQSREAGFQLRDTTTFGGQLKMATHVH